MNCRKDIRGRKLWVDDNNSHSLRPDTIDVALLRDGEQLKIQTMPSSDTEFVFACQPVYKNDSQKYIYTVDEVGGVDGYRKSIDGFIITNVLENITISGTKTWVDNEDEFDRRPAYIELRLVQNGVVVATQQLDSPSSQVSTVDFTFGEWAFANELNIPYVYRVEEEPIEFYIASYDGFDITNTYYEP